MSQPTPPPDPEIDAMLRDPAAQAWFEEHLTELRQDAYGQRILYWSSPRPSSSVSWPTSPAIC
jgi:hypothetical protein